MTPTIVVLDLPSDRENPWEDAQAAPAAVPVEPKWGQRLSEAEVAVEAEGPEAVICHCVQVKLGTLQSCIARGCSSVDALARETGATTVCGGCTRRVAALVSGASGGPVRLVAVREISPQIRSFRFEALDPRKNPLRPFLPGQHVIVSGMIAARWVSRPYTLTSPAGDGSSFEVTVQLEPDGLLSPWLFLRGPDFNAIHLTPPQGEFYVDLERLEPIVFLVGGIGVTPALATARTIAAEGLDRAVHIDYSARAEEDLAFRRELEAIAADHPNIRLRFRVTAREGERLEAEDLLRYHREIPDARYYVCGSERYQDAVSEHLRCAGVGTERIHVESFRLTSRAAQETPTARDAPAPRRLRDSLILGTGLTLLLGYLAQGAFGWDWPWLAALQDVETYRRWSGAVLLGYLAAQWVLPVLRLRGRLRAAAAAYPWHRWLGALAPAFFYAHAVRPGFGYLFALSAVYLANVAVGLADRTLVRDPVRRERYGRIWLVPHVTLACLTVGLVLFHIVVVFAYQ